jgi:carboxymethylenebutenolidase
MDQKIITLFDTYTHGGMNRRSFLDKLTLLVGSTAAASALLPVLENNYAQAALVPEDDPRLNLTDGEIAPGIKGLLAIPKEATGKLPTVLVIHENRGLNPHIKDVTRRMALEGFVAFGADYLAPQGGTPTDEEKGKEMIGKITPEDQVAYSQAAVADPALAAGVAYYGRQAPAADVPKITAPLMLHYASLDERINAGIADYEAALKAAGKSYELYMYEGANHAFNNDSNAARYNKEAADLAWSRTVAFLKKYAGGTA